MWNNFELTNPEFLWLLVLVPLLAIWYFFVDKKDTATFKISNTKGFGEQSMLSKPEYKVVNGNVYLTLRNKISQHIKTIPDSLLNVIQNRWKAYNETQRKVLQYLFYNNQATIADFVKFTGINEKTIRLYLNKFVSDNIIDRLSQKIRDKNALYVLKKH